MCVPNKQGVRNVRLALVAVGRDQFVCANRVLGFRVPCEVSKLVS
jgi:hypothetical protein